MPEEVLADKPMVVPRRGAWVQRLVDTLFGPGVPMEVTLHVPPRKFDYNAYTNLERQPRSGSRFSFATLRQVADRCDLQRLVIETRKDQVERVRWSIKPSDDEADPEDGAYAKRIEEVTKFFLKPDGVQTWKQWIRCALEDVLVIDALSCYVRKTLKGDVFALELLDGATIRPMLDERGATPREGVAYQQIVKGEIAGEFTLQDLYYVVRNPRTWTPYGFGPVEQMMTTVAIALNKQNSELSFYTEGNVPEALIGTPDDWPVSKTQEFQAYWDQLTADPKMRRRALFIPGQIAKNYIPTRVVDLKDDHSEWLARVIAFGHSLPPTAFVKQMNRAQAELVQDVALEEGLMPILEFLSDTLLKRVIQEGFGYEDLTWNWEDLSDPDILKEAQVNEIYIKLGVKSVDTVADEIGQQPPGLGPAVWLTDGPILIEDLLEKREMELESLRNPPQPMVVGPTGQPVPGVPGQSPKFLPPPTGRKQDMPGQEQDEEEKKAKKLAGPIGFVHDPTRMEQAEALTVGLYKFNPSQPRDPKGTATGGQWRQVEGAIAPIYGSAPVRGGKPDRGQVKTDDSTIGSNLPDDFRAEAEAKLKRLYKLTPADLEANIESVYLRAMQDPRTKAHAAWYQEAQQWAQDMRHGDRYTLQQTVAALAAQSPSHDWGSNAMTSAFTAWMLQHETKTVVQLDRATERLARIQLAATSKRKTGKAGKFALNGRLMSDLSDAEAAAVIKAVAQGHHLAFYNDVTGKYSRTFWSCGQRGVEASIAVLRGGEPDVVLGGHKVRSFYNNILEGKKRSSNVTIDTHAYSIAVGKRLTAELIGDHGLFDSPGTVDYSVKGGYYLFADAYRKVAKKYDRDPKEVQASTWMWWRLYVPKVKKPKKVSKMAIPPTAEWDEGWSDVELDPWAHWWATGSTLGLSPADRALIRETEREIDAQMAHEEGFLEDGAGARAVDAASGLERVPPFPSMRDLGKAYNPQQARHPKGSERGGEWSPGRGEFAGVQPGNAPAPPDAEDTDDVRASGGIELPAPIEVEPRSEELDSNSVLRDELWLEPSPGECYGRATRYASAHDLPGLTVMHGSIGTKTSRMTHGWVEFPSADGVKKVYDGALGKFFLRDSFYENLLPKVDAQYTQRQATTMAKMLKHWGPWQ